MVVNNSAGILFPKSLANGFNGTPNGAPAHSPDPATLLSKFLTAQEEIESYRCAIISDVSSSHLRVRVATETGHALSRSMAKPCRLQLLLLLRDMSVSMYNFLTTVP
jgi:hypothetical protein